MNSEIEFKFKADKLSSDLNHRLPERIAISTKSILRGSISTPLVVDKQI
jgi:hypothetical protein